jgi:arylsulfatase A-like enzyme
MTDFSNIILFMLDQLSAKWLEAARAGACPTPNFDRLAARSTTFTNAFASYPVCCPSRATLATGLTCRQHGVTANGYELDPKLPTFMRLLQQNGWRTGCFGKLHLHPHFAGLHPDYTPYGFDVTHITEDPRGGEWLDWIQTEHPKHHRYTWYPQNGGEQLFDLQNDADETINHSENPAYADIRLDLREKLMNDIVLQDYPPSRRNLFSIGVH